MSIIVESLKKMIAGGLTTEQPPKAPIDISPDVDQWRKIRRRVWVGHIGAAGPGDEVLIDETELKQPAIRNMLCTNEEFARMQQREAEALLAQLEGKPARHDEQFFDPEKAIERAAYRGGGR